MILLIIILHLICSVCVLFVDIKAYVYLAASASFIPLQYVPLFISDKMKM